MKIRVVGNVALTGDMESIHDFCWKAKKESHSEKWGEEERIIIKWILRK
jgi:hypothetical protein